MMKYQVEENGMHKEKDTLNLGKYFKMLLNSPNSTQMLRLRKGGYIGFLRVIEN